MKEKNKQDGKTGNGHGPVKNQKIKYPVTFELKIVMENTMPEEQLQQSNERVLTNNQVSFKYLSSKPSARGNYVSMTYNVTLTSQSQMNLLYEELKFLPGIKFAL